MKYMAYYAAALAIALLPLPAYALSQSASSDASSGQSSLVDKEQMSAPIPDGFREASHQVTKSVAIFTYIPTNKSTRDRPNTNWPSVHIMHIKQPLPRPLDDATSGMFEEMKADCVTSATRKLGEGDENGYPYTEWLMSCDLDKKTGKSVYMVMKAVAGRTSFSEADFTYGKVVTEADIATALDYLKTVTVCDAADTSAKCTARP